jgi:hypothetical protein
MGVSKSKRAEIFIGNWGKWFIVVGIIITGFVTPITLALTYGQHSALPPICAVVGGILLCFPAYLRLRLWPFLAAYLILGMVGALLIPSPPGLICALAAILVLCLSLGLFWWRARQAKA